MSQHPSPEGELARLHEELALSRRELAETRTRLEAALEELARVDRPVAADGSAAPEGRTPVLGRLADRLRRGAP